MDDKEYFKIKQEILAHLDFDPKTDVEMNTVKELPSGMDMYRGDAGGGRTEEFGNDGKPKRSQIEKLMNSLHRIDTTNKVLFDRQKEFEQYVRRRLDLLEPLFRKLNGRGGSGGAKF